MYVQHRGEWFAYLCNLSRDRGKVGMMLREVRVLRTHCGGPVGFERNMEADRSSGGSLTPAGLVFRDGISCVLSMHVVPRQREGHCRIAEEFRGKDGEHREPVIAHDYKRSALLI